MEQIRLSLLMVTLAISSNSIGQIRNAHWLFWRNHLDFSSGAPVMAANLDGTQAFAGISDTTGQLKAYLGATGSYSNCYDAMHQLIPGQADNLSVHGTGPGRALANFIPRPGHPDEAFLAYVNRPPGVTPAIYRIGLVAMDLGPPGQLAESMEAETYWIISDVAMWMCVVPHANGTDYWLVTQPIGGNAFHAFQITQDGADPDPVISYAGPPRLTDWKHGMAVPDREGAIIAVSTRNSVSASAEFDSLSMDLFTFNPALGTMDHWTNLPSNRPEGIEFSPSGRFLYVLEDAPIPSGEGVVLRLVQYDLQSADISGSRFLLHEYTQGPSWVNAKRHQLNGAIDGRIYRCRNALSDTLGVIMDPNLPAPLCNYVHDGFVCADDIGSLPNPLKRYHDSPNVITSAQATTSAPLRIAPQPLVGSGSLTHADLNGPLQLAWHDATGRVARTMTVQADGGRALLDATGLAPGGYMLRISGGGLQVPLGAKVLVAQ
jgi:hypothetical protein